MVLSLWAHRGVQFHAEELGIWELGHFGMTEQCDSHRHRTIIDLFSLQRLVVGMSGITVGILPPLLVEWLSISREAK